MEYTDVKAAKDLYNQFHSECVKLYNIIRRDSDFSHERFDSIAAREELDVSTFTKEALKEASRSISVWKKFIQDSVGEKRTTEFTVKHEFTPQLREWVRSLRSMHA